MLEMVNLLDLSRMELGTYAFRPQAVDLADVMGRVLLDLQGLAGPAGVQVRWKTARMPRSTPARRNCFAIPSWPTC